MLCRLNHIMSIAYNTMSKISRSGFISLKVIIMVVFMYHGVNHFSYFPESFTATDWVLDILIGESLWV